MNINQATLPFSCVLILVLLFANQSYGDEFFRIDKVRFLDQEPKDKKGIYTYKPHPKHRHRTVIDKFVPCLAVTVSAQEKILPEELTAKVYFYAKDYRLLATAYGPSEVQHAKSRKRHRWPHLISPKKETLYFEIPSKVKEQENWEALVVFGDQKGMTAKLYPGRLMAQRLKYLEKKLVTQKRKVKRKAFQTNLVEHVIKTRHHKHKQITFFIRPPVGTTNLEQVDGVLAVCLLANNVSGLKRAFLKETKPGGRLGTLATLADQHNLAMLCWGSQKMWITGKSWDELNEKELHRVEEAQEVVMEAWGKGVDELAKKYGLPNEHFLLTGYSAAAHFTLRLAMRQPRYFLAVHAHIPNSFDKPTQEANKILWCLTTGELDAGYERSLKFYQTCRAMGYPMIYKSIIGLGHSSHRISDELSLAFFEYALTKKDKKIHFLSELKNPLGDLRLERLDHPDRPWLDDFVNPKYVGDKVNQEMFPAKDRDLVPESFQVPLPTRELATTWDQNP